MQPAQAPVTYNASKTYIALLMSDMDKCAPPRPACRVLRPTRSFCPACSLDFVQGDGFRAMQQRVEMCGNGTACFPLTWTLQPNLRSLSPAMLRWYFQLASRTGRDRFVLPPSGALYAYPSQFPSDLQAEYVRMTNDAGRVLNTSASADWEFLGDWPSAFRSYFPQYQAAPDGVKLFLLDQVPYVLPMPSMGFDKVKVLGDPSTPESVVLVRPPFTVASAGTWDNQKPGLYPADIAKQINALDAGDVTCMRRTIRTSAAAETHRCDMLIARLRLSVVRSLLHHGTFGAASGHQGHGWPPRPTR